MSYWIVKALKVISDEPMDNDGYISKDSVIEKLLELAEEEGKESAIKEMDKLVIKDPITYPSVTWTTPPLQPREITTGTPLVDPEKVTITC